jgi:hypothetical protein
MMKRFAQFLRKLFGPRVVERSNGAAARQTVPCDNCNHDHSGERKLKSPGWENDMPFKVEDNISLSDKINPKTNKETNE